MRHKKWPILLQCCSLCCNGVSLFEAKWERTNSCWRLRFHFLGNLFSFPIPYFERFISFQVPTVLLFGLDGSGKTSILYRMKLGDDFSCTKKKEKDHNIIDDDTKNNILNVESWGLEGVDACTFYDISGQTKIRPLWHNYLKYRSNNNIIFVVDSTRLDRMEEARKELHKLLLRHNDNNNDLHCSHNHTISILVFANKQDLPKNSSSLMMSDENIIEGLDLCNIPCGSQCEWHVQPCSALNGDGLREGIEWLLPGRETLVK